MATLKVYASEAAANKAGATGTYYTSIQEAVNAANSGDKIEIAAGEYEAFGLNSKTPASSVNNKDLTFVGETDAEGKNLVKIKGVTVGYEGVRNGPAPVYYIGNLTFQNVDFTERFNLEAAGNSKASHTIKIEKCNFIGDGVVDANFDAANGGTLLGSSSGAANYTWSELIVNDCTFSDGNINFWRNLGGHTFTDCIFNNAPVSLMGGGDNESFVFDSCKFNIVINENLQNVEAFCLRVDDRKFKTITTNCEFSFTNPDNLVAADGVKWAYLWTQMPNGGSGVGITLEDSKIVTGENVDDVDVYINLNAHQTYIGSDSVNAGTIGAEENQSYEVKLEASNLSGVSSDAFKGVANVTIENVKEDGTTEIIVTDETGDNLLVGSVNDKGQLTIDAEKSQGDDYMDIVADYFQPGEGDQYTVYVVTPDNVITGYTSFDAAEAKATPADKLWVTGTAASEGTIMNNNDEKWGEVADSTYAGIEVDGSLTAGAAIVMHNAEFKVNAGGFVQTSDGALRIMGENASLSIEGKRPEGSKYATEDVLVSTHLGGTVEYTDNVSAVVNALHLSYGATGSIKNANVVINTNQGIVIGRTPADMELKEGVVYSGELTLDNSAIVMFDQGSYAGPVTVQVINGSSFYLKNNSVITPAVGTTGASLESALVIDEDSSFFVDGTSDITVDDVDNAGKIYLHVNADENFKFYRWEGDGAVTEAEGNIFVAGATMTVGNDWKNTGTLLVDLKDYDKYIAKIVDYVGDKELTYLGYGNVELMNGDYTAIVIDNDLYVTNADMTKVVVDKGWTNTTALQNDLYLNINALKTLSGALKQFVPETEEIIINVDNTEEDAPASDMTIQLEKDLDVIGKKTDKIDGDDIAWNNEEGFTVNFTKAEDADAKLSFQNINLNAGPKSTILFGVDTEFDKDSSLTLWNGNVNSGATLTLNGAALKTNGTEAFNVEGGAKWIVNGTLPEEGKEEEWTPQVEVHYSNIFDGGSLELNRTYFKANDELQIGDAGTVIATDSKIVLNEEQAGNHVNDRGNLKINAKDSVLTLFNSEFAGYGDALNNGTINIDGSKFSVTNAEDDKIALTNNGTINISGESTVNVTKIVAGKGSSINALDGAVITDSVINGTISNFGTVSYENITVSALDIGYYNSGANVVVNITGDNNDIYNFMVVNRNDEGYTSTLNIGSAEEDAERTTVTCVDKQMQLNFGDNSIVNINNADVTAAENRGGYASFHGKITITDSTLTGIWELVHTTKGLDGAATVIDNSTVSSVWGYIGYYNGYNAEGEYGTHPAEGDFILKNQAALNLSTTMMVSEDGKITMTDGSSITAGGSFTNLGSITMDASSSIKAGSTNFRTEDVKDDAGEVIGKKVLNAITIDAAEFTGFNKVLDFKDDIAAEDGYYTIINQGDVEFFIHDGDLYATTIDTTDRYIDAAWADMSLDTEYGDSVAADKVFGYNAFGNLADALVDAPEDITLNIIASDIEYVAPDADKGIPEEIHKIDAAATIEGDVTLKGEATFTGNQLTVNGALNITEEADFTFENTVMVKGELDITDAEAEFSKLSVLGNATVGADADVIVNSLTIRDDDGSFSVVDGAVVTVNNTLNVGYEANVTSQIGTLEVTDATFAANKALNVTGGSSATFTNANVTLTGVTGGGDIAISDSEVTVQANSEFDYYGKITLDDVTIKGAGYLDLSSANRITVESDLTVTDNANVVFAELTNNYAGEIYIKDGASLTVNGGSLASDVEVSGGASFVVTDDLILGKNINITLADGNLTLDNLAVLTGKKSYISMDHLSTISFTYLNDDGRIAEGAITIDLTNYDNGKDGACVLFDNINGWNLTKDDYQVIIGDDYDLSSGAFYVNAEGDLIYDLDNVTAFNYDEIADADEFVYIDNADTTYDTAVAHQGVESFIKQGTFEGTVSGGTIHDNGFTEAEVKTGHTDLTVDGGTFEKIVAGGDRLEDGFIYRDGDSNLTINGGEFTMVVGGSIFAGKDVKSNIIQEGNINLTINGGTISSDIYGGHVTGKGYGDCTRIQGNITVTIDAAVQLKDDRFIVAGSFEGGRVYGNTNVVFKGDAAKGGFLANTNTVWGGSTLDGYITENGKRVFNSKVLGSRTITFDDFDGKINAAIRGFDTFQVLGGSDVEVAYENLSDITAWEFDADTEFAGAFGDIAGDTLKINGDEIKNGWTLGGAGEIKGLFETVEIDGDVAKFADGAWITENYKLEIVEGKSLMFSALALA